MATPKTALVYGGSGALGKQAVKQFNQAGYRTIAVDFVKNDEAAVNILSTLNADPQAQLTEVVDQLVKINPTLDVVACAAGGWAGGSITAQDLMAGVDKMWKFNVLSSLVASQVAAKFIKKGGLLVLTGSSPALGPTAGMIAYGISKAAVHQLTQSLAQNSNFTTVAIAPITLDTPANRAGMPGADLSTWTPLEDVTKKILEWSEKGGPKSGSILEVVTKNSVSSWNEQHTHY